LANVARCFLKTKNKKELHMATNSLGKVIGACLVLALAARVVPLFGQSKPANVPLGRAEFQKTFQDPNAAFGDLSRFKLGSMTPAAAQNNFTNGSFSAALLKAGLPISFRTDFGAALKEANSAKKPLVMFIYRAGGPQSETMAKTLADISMNEFSGKAVFLKLEESSREGNYYLGQANEEKCPIVGVYDVADMKQLQEIEHSLGAYSPADYVPIFRRIMDKAVKSVEASGYAQRVTELAKTEEDKKANAREIFTLLQKAAALGNVQAINDLGVAFDQGIGTNVDYAKALEWYRKGADLGNPISQHNVGIYYEQGRQVSRNLTTAMEYFRKAAEGGIYQSMRKLGYFYRDGDGVARDYTQAFAWFQKAADKGDAESISNIAWMYENGKSVERNIAKARELYQKAADLGDKWSKDQLSNMK
jgi:TPR repeat protein